MIWYNGYMDWALRHQITILFGVLITSALVVGLFVWQVFFVSDPTCFDSAMNGTETGVDCGGSCELMCRDESRNLVTLWTRALPVTDSVYNLATYIENQNTNAGIRRMTYRFRVYDENNFLITEREGETYISPNQRSLILEPRVDMGSKEPFAVFFEITSPQVWRRTSGRLSTSPLRIEQADLSLSGFSPRLTATLTNTTQLDISDVSLVAILYDANDNALAASSTYLPQIVQGTREPLVFTWPRTFLDEPARFEIIPQINVFHEDNRQYSLFEGDSL